MSPICGFAFLFLNVVLRFFFEEYISNALLCIVVM